MRAVFLSLISAMQGKVKAFTITHVPHMNRSTGSSNHYRNQSGAAAMFSSSGIILTV
uniref:Uncharacterized protein n=1 Tax=Anguilla anguilla TaxID=7936 RepID=A0A0E9SPY0_ANGAN